MSSQEARGGGEREGGVQAPGRRLLLAAWRECPASHLRGQQDPRPPALRVGAEQLNGVQVAGSRAGSRAGTSSPGGSLVYVSYYVSSPGGTS